MAREAYVFEALRTPRGRGKPEGSLHEVQPVELLAGILRELARRCDLDTAEVEDVIVGCVSAHSDQGGNIAKSAVQLAGWDDRVAAVQLNRFCASGLESVNSAAMHIRSGWFDLIVAGGVESMSRVPMGSDGGSYLFDPEVGATLNFVPQGISADLLATIEGFGRRELDEFACLSHRRAAFARDNGYFKSLVPVTDRNGLTILDHDEHVRVTTMEGLGQLTPSFQALGELGVDERALQRYVEFERINHVHTPGNSSGIVDGAAAVLVGSRDKGRALGLRARAKVVACAVVGTEPLLMLSAPAPASRRALEVAGMTIADIDLIEVNEAFAAVPLRFLRDMGIDTMDRVNVNGGAIALGHPLGATGACLLSTVLDELERRGLGTALITLCVGGGMGIAGIFERV